MLPTEARRKGTAPQDSVVLPIPYVGLIVSVGKPMNGHITCPYCQIRTGTEDPLLSYATSNGVGSNYFDVYSAWKALNAAYSLSEPFTAAVDHLNSHLNLGTAHQTNTPRNTHQ